MPPSQRRNFASPHHTRMPSGVRVLDFPTRSVDGRTICQCVVAERTPIHAAALARVICKQVSAPPFNIAGARVRPDHPHIIEAPWALRQSLAFAVASLRSQDTLEQDERELRRQVDSNTMASLIGLGGGIARHISPARRRLWRFSQFSLVETFGIASIKWRAFDAAEEFAGTLKIPFVQITGGFNTPTERRRMGERLMVACDLRL